MILKYIVRPCYIYLIEMRNLHDEYALDDTSLSNIPMNQPATGS